MDNPTTAFFNVVAGHFEEWWATDKPNELVLLLPMNTNNYFHNIGFRITIEPIVNPSVIPNEWEEGAPHPYGWKAEIEKAGSNGVS